MITITIEIKQEANGVVASRATSTDSNPTAGEVRMLARFHELLTKGAASQAASDKRTMMIVDQSTNLKTEG